MRMLFQALIVLGLTYIGPVFAATVHVDPKAALYDAPVHVVIDGLKPGALITLKLSTTDAKGHKWQ